MNRPPRKHAPPRYYGYKPGTFATVTMCTKCCRTALREDQHPVNPCPDCGGPVRDACAGRWEPPVVKWRWTPLPHRVTVTSGYWILRGYINKAWHPGVKRTIEGLL